MANVLQVLPEVQGEEMIYLQEVLKDMPDERAMKFAAVYRTRRKDPTVILILVLLGFILLAGVHRFVLDRIGTGLLWLFTGGILYIGTIVDLVNYKRLTFEYNRKQADMIAVTLRA
jgi:TM2 domain-containing membrane protein YozV